MSMRASSVAIVALVALLASAAWAQEEAAFRDRAHAPGPALGAAFANVVYMPVRLGLSILWAEVGGVTGLMTAGNRHAAEDVWEMFDGSAILTPGMMQGTETFRFGTMEFGAR